MLNKNKVQPNSKRWASNSKRSKILSPKIGSIIFEQSSTCHPKVFIKTFGCQMNVRDSEFAAGILIDSGFRLADSINKADVVVFNSCSVRKHAEERLFGNIACLKSLKKERPEIVIVLMGCTAQAYEGKAIDRSGLIDIVCGTGNEADLPRLIKSVLKNRYRIVAVDKINEKKPEAFPEYREHKFKALVSIGEGCNNFCSYCIVPYVRGRERSRDVRSIVREVEDLASRGFKEITLLGQNVNSYGKSADHRLRTADFVNLLERINTIDGIERIRFMTSHPKDAHRELFRAMRDLDKVCEHLHLPLQSGSDRILKLMNRGYNSRKYLKLAEDYKRIVPGGSITTDVMVGFPSERDGDFRKTCNVMKDVGFDSAYTFKYSPRVNTKSYKLTDDVSPDVKVSRLEFINSLQCGISENINKRFVDKVVEVLVEGPNEKDAAMLNGRTRTNKPVVFRGGRSLTGKLVKVEVESAAPYALRGRIIG